MVRRALIVCFAFFAALALQAQTTLDAIGVTQLRSLGLGLTGSGVKVAQPEATSGYLDGNNAFVDNNDFQVNPSAVGQPQSLFNYINFSGATATGSFPNSVGVESGHADTVGAWFYGTSGVAPGVTRVDNYNATYFFNTLIYDLTSIDAKLVNQSFIFTGTSTGLINQAYDKYVVSYGTVFVSGVGNGGSVNSPATCYNGIGVAVKDGGSSVGPTSDGRSKPDITAFGNATSYSTPMVSGAAAILVQAGNAEMGGAGTATAAVDPRTVKALLLNGAVKPLNQPNAADNWTRTIPEPLDRRYGAGVLNVFNSFRQLQGGMQPFTVMNTSQTIPSVSGSNVGVLAGWNYGSLTTSGNNKRVAHYLFDLSAAQACVFTVTSTLVWNRGFQGNQPHLNNLDLFLYNTSGTLIASSVSTVDNVEHLFVQNLPPGRYDLQVLKNSTGGSSSEPYALAFDFSQIALSVSVSHSENGNVIKFPSTSGHTYRVERSPDLTANSWTTVSDISGTGTDVSILDTNALNEPQQFYRVRLLQ